MPGPAHRRFPYFYRLASVRRRPPPFHSAGPPNIKYSDIAAWQLLFGNVVVLNRHMRCGTGWWGIDRPDTVSFQIHRVFV